MIQIYLYPSVSSNKWTRKNFNNIYFGNKTAMIVWKNWLMNKIIFSISYKLIMTRKNLRKFILVCNINFRCNFSKYLVCNTFMSLCNPHIHIMLEFHESTLQSRISFYVQTVPTIRVFTNLTYPVLCDVVTVGTSLNEFN